MLIPKSFFEDVGRTPQVVAGWIMAVFAVLCGLLVVAAVPVGLVFIVLQGDWAFAPVFAGCMLVWAALAMLTSFVARRLLRGIRSANGVTILPFWLIQGGGVVMLLGTPIVFVMAPVPVMQRAELCAGGLLSGISAILAPWLIRRRI